MRLIKKKNIIAVLVLFSLFCTMLNGTVSSAGRVKTHEGSKVIVGVDVKYKISQILKDVCDVDTGRKMSKVLKHKKVKWTSSSKNVTVTKNSFKVKKSGTYKLTGRVKKNKYIVFLEVVDRYPRADLSDVTYMTIRSGSDGSIVTIDDVEPVQNLCQMVHNAGFAFDYKLAKKGPMTGWSYAVRFYSSDGRERFALLNSTPAYYYTSGKCDDIYKFTDELFKAASSH